ncbi:MAG: hypothetical protein RL432_1590, partial [Bacteroidota bacterium]
MQIIRYLLVGVVQFHRAKKFHLIFQIFQEA